MHTYRQRRNHLTVSLCDYNDDELWTRCVCLSRGWMEAADKSGQCGGREKGGAVSPSCWIMGLGVWQCSVSQPVGFQRYAVSLYAAAEGNLSASRFPLTLEWEVVRSSAATANAAFSGCFFYTLRIMPGTVHLLRQPYSSLEELFCVDCHISSQFLSHVLNVLFHNYLNIRY